MNAWVWHCALSLPNIQSATAHVKLNPGHMPMRAEVAEAKRAREAAAPAPKAVRK